MAFEFIQILGCGQEPSKEELRMLVRAHRVVAVVGADRVQARSYKEIYAIGFQTTYTQNGPASSRLY